MVWKSCKRIKIQQRESHIKENRVLHLSTSFFVYFVSQVFCHCQMTQLAFIYFFNKSIYLFILAALGLRCCTWAFSSCGERGLLFVVVRGLLIAVASLAAQRVLQARGFQQFGMGALERRLSSCGSRALERRLSCGARAQLLRGMQGLPGPGLKPVSPALTGGFFLNHCATREGLIFFFFNLNCLLVSLILKDQYVCVTYIIRIYESQ